MHQMHPGEAREHVAAMMDDLRESEAMDSSLASLSQGVPMDTRSDPWSERVALLMAHAPSAIDRVQMLLEKAEAAVGNAETEKAMAYLAVADRWSKLFFTF